MSGLRVVLAEDDVLLREGLILLDARDSRSSGRPATVPELQTLVHEENRRRWWSVNIRMPPTHTAEGLEAARHIQQEHPETGILVLSARVEVEYAMELLASGRGIGYLLKSPE